MSGSFRWMGLVVCLGLPASVPAQGLPPEGSKRIVFLGDSITHAGQYVEDLEAYTRIKLPALTM